MSKPKKDDRTNVAINANLHKKLTAYSKLTGISIRKIVEEAVSFRIFHGVKNDS